MCIEYEKRVGREGGREKIETKKNIKASLLDRVRKGAMTFYILLAIESWILWSKKKIEEEDEEKERKN